MVVIWFGVEAWVWDLGISLPSNSRYVFIFWMMGAVRTEPCAPGIAQYNLCGSIPPEHVDPSHSFHLHLSIHSF